MPVAKQPVVSITASQARLVHLHAQGLLHKPAMRATPALLEQAIARMRILQIDTIHVVARSPYLTLFARVGDYPQQWLDDLLETGRVAECWAHEASFVPSAHYPLHLACQPLRAQHWAQRHARRTRAEHAQGMRDLLTRIREHGALRAADFSRAAPGASGWWQWKPEKRWLEAWFALGELMVARRDGFQRVYDLSERVRARHPAATESPASAASARRQAIVHSIHALGVAQARWVGDYFRLSKVTTAELDALVQQGELVRADVGGWGAPAYMCAGTVEIAQKAAQGRLRATHTALLSPFDPVVWDRARARTMFDFSYTLECYVPAQRRQYGYFVLPILHRGQLIGRLDAKAHRKQGHFEVKALAMQAGVQPQSSTVRDVANALAGCAAWHGTPEVTLARTLPRLWRSALLAQLP